MGENAKGIKYSFLILANTTAEVVLSDGKSRNLEAGRHVIELEADRAYSEDHMILIEEVKQELYTGT